MAATHLAIGDCPTRCGAATCGAPGAEQLRRDWGCDEPAPNPTIEIACPRCSGHDPDCPRCVRGIRRLYRCGQFYLNGVGDVLRAYSMVELGILPDPGGWVDQSAALIDAFDLIRAERGRVQQEEERAVKARQRQAQTRGSRR